MSNITTTKNNLFILLAVFFLLTAADSFIITANASIQDTNSENVETQDILETSLNDTIAIRKELEDIIDEGRIKILEETSKQFGTWATLLGVLVGSISVLFTVISIIMAYFIFRQNKKHRSNLEEIVNEAKNIIIEQANSEKQRLEKFSDEQILKLEDNISKAKDESSKEILVSQLEDLKKRKEELDQNLDNRLSKMKKIFDN